jgi:predicted DNA-binding WGR domain protein
MRRLELSEGTSNKFWQVERDDATMRVQFGRIGTAGQTQEKAFASATAAQAEVDKLIKEKVKKGYAEVGAPAATTPAPGATAAPPKPKPRPKAVPAVAPAPPPVVAATAPAPAPPAAPAPEPPSAALSAQPRIAWTDAALRAAAPIRGSDVVPARKPDPKAQYARIAKAFQRVASLLEQGSTTADFSEGLTTAHVDQALTSAAREAFASAAPPGALDLDAQAAAFALVGPPIDWNDEPRGDAFVGYWAALAGPSFALRALARADGLHVLATSGPHSDLGALAIVDVAPNDMAWWRARSAPPWRALRNAVVLAPDDEHAALVAEAQALARTASPNLRASLAAAFERLDWARDDLAGFAGGNPPSWVWGLVVSTPTAKLPALLDRVKGWHLMREIGQLRFDLLARLGAEDGARVFLGLLDANASAGADALRTLAEALALVVSPSVAEYFVKQLGTKEIRAVAAEYLQTHAEVSVVPLARAASVGKGAAAEAARAVLRPVVSAGGAAVAAARGALTAAERAVIGELEEQGTAREEATPDELPRVLRTPPWTTKPTLAAPVVISSLPPLPFEERMAWRAGEAEQRRSSVRWMDEEPGPPAKLHLAKIRAVSEGAPPARSYQMESATIFAKLPLPALLEVGPEVNLAKFSWSYWEIANVIVARHGVAAVDFALRTAEVDATAAVVALERAVSPRVAPLMADAFARLKKVRGVAAGWLAAFPEAAAIGLIQHALGPLGKPRQAAEGALRYAAGRGHRAVIEGVAARWGADAEAGIRAVLDFDPLQVLPAKLPKLPSFWNAGAFTRPLLAGGKKALPLAAVDAIGTMLSFTSLDDPYAGIADVKAACDARSLAELAWDLFQAWLLAGAPSKEGWAFTAMALLGDDECARRLTPLVRAWPGEAAHARAVVGLDVLAAIGTDVALMHLHGIAQKLKFKGLQEKAREKIDDIAVARGFTSDELADRLVPDLGLDDRGTLELDFGPRRFRVTFDEMLKPAVLDQDGKRLPDLPKPKQSDDAEKAQGATEAWKTLKKDAKVIAAGQILRLELAMCAQRVWPKDVFQRFLVEHPLLVHLVRRLVWAVYGEEGPTATFRVAEDGSFADPTDVPFEVPEGAEVGVVHRLELDDATAAAWGQVLGDYEILQPFEQLSRATVTATDEEKAAEKLDRAAGLEVPTGKVLGLDARGWRRGPAEDSGVVGWYEKPVGGGLVACLDLDPGIFTGMIAEAPSQKLGSVTLVRRGDRWSRTAGARFGELPAIAFSELARDLASLRP